jgi:recombinational DNA repair protein RecT
VTDYEAMAVKTAVRRLRPFLPMSIEMETAFAADETARLYSGEDNGVVDVAPADAAIEAGAEPQPEPDAGESPANDEQGGAPGNGEPADAAPDGGGGQSDGEPDPGEPDADTEAARQEQLGAAS